MEYVPWLKSLGFDAATAPPLDGVVHRLNRGSSSKSGWFIGWQEPFPFAIAGDWRTGERFECSEKNGRKLKPHEQKQREILLREAQQKSLAEREGKQEAARLKADMLWRSGTNGGFLTHDYLTKKNIGAFGVRVLGEDLLIPTVDADGVMHGLQKIKPDGAKLFLTGQRVDATFHRIVGDNLKGIYICEGYATGASIHMATGGTVYCAWSASNLVKVADLVTLMHADLKERITIAGDDDRFSEGNAGRKAALAAAGRNKLLAVFPTFKSDDGEPTDFNDLHCADGIEAVGRAFGMAETGGNKNVVSIAAGRKDEKNKPGVKNYEEFERSTTKGPVTIRRGLQAPLIHSQLKAEIGDWPRRIGGRLFCLGPDNEILWVDRPADLFGLVSGSNIDIGWARVDSAISKDEFMSYLRAAVTCYAGASALPHFPPRPDYFYSGKPLPADNGAFGRLLDFFNPASVHDGALLKAAFMTLFWGGPSGARPAFVLSGMDADEAGGRGVGKTAVTDAMARLAGGAIDFSASMKDIEAAKKRLLTTSGERIVRFDNVKAERLSNGDIEALITAPHISGHLMYVGEGKVANDFTYMFTFNDVSFSKDMAQRAIQIRLKRPCYSADWFERLAEFIRAEQYTIVAGIAAAFQVTPVTGEVLRFGQWTRDVLFRATQTPEIVAMIQAGQKETDDDDDLSEDIDSIVRHKLSKYSVSTTLSGRTAVPYMIRGSLMGQWLREGLGLHKASTRHLFKMLGRVYAERRHDGYRCFIFKHDGQVTNASDEQIPGAYLIFDAQKTVMTEHDFVPWKA